MALGEIGNDFRLDRGALGFHPVKNGSAGALFELRL